MNILLLGLIFIFPSEGLDVNVVAKQEKIENKVVIKEEENFIESVRDDESDIDFPSYVCDYNMKLWKNRTYNFRMCIPTYWGGIGAYDGGLNYLSDTCESIGDRTGSKISFSKIEAINGKEEYSGSSFEIKIGKNLYYGFYFHEKTDEMKKIINSIKVLDKSKLKD